ncbi:tRNA (adenosine(37)-N6)-dimethylallyltransferase MiaA [Patescibacteria group bacterium]|nr:tRNA (adenosine(37)-N6)-dimethylallyltransferase MiaA [Patescibacteria group bacterium]
MSSSRQKIIVIVGPTSSGKTALAVTLARAIGGEVISADSRQVYRGLDSGSGKVTKKEMRGVPHHLLDIANPKRVYTASDFVRDGRAAITDISARGRIPIIAGGTGFYIDALIGTMKLSDVPPNKTLRNQLSRYSLEKLQNTLKKLDPKRYVLIDTKNPVRLIRAIEIAKAHKGKPREKITIYGNPNYQTLFIGIHVPPEDLKKKIHTRLVKRLPGIEREVKKLHARGLSWKRMEELGLEYRYMSRYLKGVLSKKEMHIELEKAIVEYAKRQMTWFKRNRDIHWLPPTDSKKATSLSRAFLGLRKKRV